MHGIAPLKIDVKAVERKTFNRFFCEENSMIRTNSREWRDFEFFYAIEIRSLEYWLGFWNIGGEVKSVIDPEFKSEEALILD